MTIYTMYAYTYRLDKNGIGFGGAVAVGEAFAVNQTLQTLR